MSPGVAKVCEAIGNFAHSPLLPGLFKKDGYKGHYRERGGECHEGLQLSRNFCLFPFLVTAGPLPRRRLRADNDARAGAG